MNVTGKVDEIITREVETKYGLKPVYDIMVGGKKYGFGFDAPSFEEGATISFDVEKNGKYLNVVKGTARESVASAASSEEAPQNYDRNRSIVRQNSLSHATQIVVALGIGDAEKAAGLAVEVARVFEAYSMCEDE